MLKYLCCSILIFLQICSFAQPQPCIDPEMTPLCQDACVICDIDGFTGVNNSQVVGIGPNDFCTTFQHNITWIAFIAGSEDLTIEVEVSGCQINWGLEIGIYESLDCETFQQVTLCDTDIQPGETGVFSNNQPLTIGQYYYFVMDGSNGDICNYTVNVTEGTTQVGALQPLDQITGPAKACPNDIQTFTVPHVDGANFTNWTINGTFVSGVADTLEYEFSNDGTYQICYDAFNVCDTIPSVCTSILIESRPPVVFDEIICEGDSLHLPSIDTFFVNAGAYNYSFIDSVGCEQQVMGIIQTLPTVYTNLELEFCFGDSVFFGGQAFTATGNYNVPLVASTMCDSVLLLDLLTFLCDIDGGFADDNLLCAGDNNGQLIFNLIDGNHPYTFEWEEETGSNLTGSGVSDLNSTTIVIPDLIAGVYSITITDNSGSVGVFVGQVFEPFYVDAQVELSEYSLANVTCPGASDGSIFVTPFNGVSPYSYNWNTGSQIDLVGGLSSGNYFVTVTDSNGCQVIKDATLIDPEPISADFLIEKPNCNPTNSGIINANLVEGGTGPYLYAYDGGDFSSNPVHAGLLPGQYSIEIEDAYGCRYEESFELLEPNTLVLDLEEQLDICLGDSIQLTPFVNLNDLDYVWSSSSNISCLDCPRPYVRPYNDGLYYLTAIMPNGCERSDSIFITVSKFRKIYFPNIFSPNNDGVNDVFRPFSSKEIGRILEFEVYNRWGSQLAAFQNLAPNANTGWDGQFNNEIVDSGVYVWRAKVEYLDGEILDYKGDVTLIR
ncbi:MAG: gliding motility-associated C-terminal domain-containing protein [Saprospiraceae bacterium]|nr:gliding motility-associated C-terminal domain-containing protein [Saprospiraceae bacterium]